MTDLNADIGRRLRTVRKRSKLSAEALGEKLGVSRQAVFSYERGDSRLSPEFAVKVADLCDVSLDWLLAGKEPAQATQEMTTEDLFAEVVARPSIMRKLLDTARDKAREEMSRYHAGGMTDEERSMLEHYRHASPEIRKAATVMLENSAKESRRNAGGGSNSHAGNCA